MPNSSLAETTQEIKGKVRIEDFIREDGVELRPRGSVLVGHHSNKHSSSSKASMQVDLKKGLYHCFNCGEGGDVYTWLELNRGMSFIEAASYLAVRVGVDLPTWNSYRMTYEERQRLERRQLERELEREFAATEEWVNLSLTHAVRETRKALTEGGYHEIFIGTPRADAFAKLVHGIEYHEYLLDVLRQKNISTDTRIQAVMAAENEVRIWEKLVSEYLN